MRAAFVLLGLGLVAAGLGPVAQAQQRANLVLIYRMYNAQTGDHLYTGDFNEVRALRERGFQYEGSPFSLAALPGDGVTPLYRYCRADGIHFYSTDGRAGGTNARNEGSIGHVATGPQQGLIPLYDWYNAQADRHLYTTDAGGEGGQQAGHQRLGIVGYVVPGR